MIRQWALFLGCVAACACAPSGPADLEAYLDQIREAGMTERARSSLHMIADIKLGGTILRFERDEATGRYRTSYAGTMCKAPGADPEAWRALQEEHARKLERELARLKPVADTDGSGFVSTSEGASFRRTMELGARTAFIYRDLEGDLGPTLEALAMGEEELAERVEAYHGYLERLPSYQKEPFVRLKIDGVTEGGV